MNMSLSINKSIDVVKSYVSDLSTDVQNFYQNITQWKEINDQLSVLWQSDSVKSEEFKKNINNCYSAINGTCLPIIRNYCSTMLTCLEALRQTSLKSTDGNFGGSPQ